MTDFDPSERDELVSAYLDGEADAAERALVESSPELLERVEALWQISSMVGEPVPVDIEQRERHIAAVSNDVYESHLRKQPAQ